MLPETTRQRLELQLESLDLLLDGMTESALMLRPDKDRWSAHENLAHLMRHHEVFLERLQRILAEDKPELGRYRAEDDREWPSRAALATDDVLTRLRPLRAEVVGSVNGYSAAQLRRIGIHPLFGEMNVTGWLEFFLLHEAHHLYTIMLRLGEAKRALRTEGAE
jgi:hypothetical protein